MFPITFITNEQICSIVFQLTLEIPIFNVLTVCRSGVQEHGGREGVIPDRGSPIARRNHRCQFRAETLSIRPSL